MKLPYQSSWSYVQGLAEGERGSQREQQQQQMHKMRRFSPFVV